jgi:hypothetical protein
MTITGWYDESGNLGFDLTKSGTSKYFIITLMLVNNRNSVIKAVKKVFASLSKTDKKHSHGILHAYYEKQSTRLKLLRLLAGRDIKIAVMKLDKSKLFVAGDPHILYASMVNMLLNRLFIEGILSADDRLHLIASQMETSKNLNEQMKSLVGVGDKMRAFDMEPVKPSDDKGLQAVDFVSWAVYRRYEYGKTDCFDVIASKIVGDYNYQ